MCEMVVVNGYVEHRRTAVLIAVPLFGGQLILIVNLESMLERLTGG